MVFAVNNLGIVIAIGFVTVILLTLNFSHKSSSDGILSPAFNSPVSTFSLIYSSIWIYKDIPDLKFIFLILITPLYRWLKVFQYIVIIICWIYVVQFFVTKYKNNTFAERDKVYNLIEHDWYIISPHISAMF